MRGTCEGSVQATLGLIACARFVLAGAASASLQPCMHCVLGSSLCLTRTTTGRIQTHQARHIMRQRVDGWMGYTPRRSPSCVLGSSLCLVRTTTGRIQTHQARHIMRQRVVGAGDKVAKVNESERLVLAYRVRGGSTCVAAAWTCAVCCPLPHPRAGVAAGWLPGAPVCLPSVADRGCSAFCGVRALRL